ncbi:MAG: hypothetical protein JXA90_06035, partial [Planctomycetes bacterium]|nr:hypothetical protein [Planctomycetota bacterium]
RLRAHRTVLRVFREEKPVVQPAGWLGSDPGTRASVGLATVVRGSSREAIAVHPPWFEGRAGTATLEFPLRLPDAKPIRLRFATAIRDHDEARGEPASDGVTVRARALPWDAPDGAEGEVLFERHSAAKTWEEADVDLARFAGKAIRLQLEVHPGPRNDTTCDQAFIAEPSVIAGTPPAADALPPAEGAASRLLGTVETGGTAYEVRIWPGKRGLLDTAIGFADGGRKLLLRGFSVRVLGEALEDWRSPAVLVAARTEEGPGLYRVRHSFSGPLGAFDLVGELAIEGGLLRARLRLENAPPPRPWLAAYIEDAAAGPWAWGGRARRVYAGHGNVIVDPGAFRLGFDGHRLATSFAGFDFETGISIVEAVDVPPDHLEVTPDDHRYTIHAPHAQTRTLIPARDVWTAAKAWRDACGREAAGGVTKLAGKFVFDLWGGRYAESARLLERSFRCGLTDAVVVWHNWQRWGYDYRLPDIYPPNPRLGSLDEMRQLAKTCADHGVLFAPHDNYIDFYPDAEGFTYDAIAFTSSGEPVKAWFNPGPKAQSYRWRSDRVREPLERNLRLIRDGLAPTAYFIDVWSSIGPYDYWTRDGEFFDRILSRNTWGEAFAWIREFLGGGAPQISESGHDQLVGWLDGAQTNHLRVSRPDEGVRDWSVWQIPCADAERIPWLDAVHHHRFVLHGAGYEGRYAAGLDRKLHGIFSDDYMATEVLTGHPAMVPSPFGRDVVRKYWLLHGAMKALALRKIESVTFADGDIHRQEVVWEGGARVLVNRGEDDWKTRKHVLPPYGFFVEVPRAPGASGADIEAAVEKLRGRTVEWSLSPDGFYANVRDGGEPLRVFVVKTGGAARIFEKEGNVAVQPLPGGGGFSLGLEWDDCFELVLGKIPPAPPASADILDEDGNVVGEVPLRREGQFVTLDVEAGAFMYRLKS